MSKSRGFRWGAPLLVLLSLLVVTAGCQSTFDQRGWADLSDDEMQSLLGLYDHELQMSWVKELTSITYGGREAGTRYEDLAGDFLIEQLSSFGLEPWRAGGLDDYRQSFDLPRGTEPSENIIAILPGKSAEHFLLIGAHYDHMGIIDGVYQPGADDNAVGTAAVLELARVFSASELTPEMSIVFVFFSGEEKGLIGSRALAEHLKQQKLDDQAVLLNLDVIAGVSGETYVIYDSGHRQNEVWIDRAEQEIAAAGLTPKVTQKLSGGVDSMRFSEAKIPAITLLWGELPADHPYLHQPSDTYDNLNPEIVAAATTASLRVAWAFAMR